MKSRIGKSPRVLVKQLESRLTLVFIIFAVSDIALAQTLKEPSVVLTTADMSLIVDDLETEVRKKLAQSVEERKAFAKEIRALLALAEAAKAERYNDRPELKLRTELTRSFVIAQAYSKTLGQSARTEEVVSPAEIEAFLKEPGTATDVAAFIDYYKNDGAVVDDARRKQLTDRYARVMIAKRKGITVGLDRERKVQLDIMLQQARLLADAYVLDHAELYKPTDIEVDRYISSHPEVDSRISRAKAEEVVKRARAGEEFSSLARQFSDEESTKRRGGNLGWFGRGEMVKPFEDAAFGLRPGEISEVVETDFGFHIIKLNERRTQLDSIGKPVEQVRVSHILINFKHSTGMGSEPARRAVESENQRKWIDEIVSRSNVVVPEDFTITAEARKP